MTAYYNEFDKYAAQWLRNLIAAGHIAPGVVDERSIEDVHPDDLRGFDQCHFFAGIGVWSLALRRAGWPDDRPVWTGSCPCQPFSSAGAGAGFDDQRHLWPHFHWLIQECRPAAVLGEQVASKDADPWIDLVCADLEAMGYAFGAIPFPAASVGAPHIRDRLYWAAVSLAGRRLGISGVLGLAPGAEQGQAAVGTGLHLGVVADTEDIRQQGQSLRATGGLPPQRIAQDSCVGGMADTGSQRPSRVDTCVRTGEVGNAKAAGRSGLEQSRGHDQRDGVCDLSSKPPNDERPGPTNGLWRDADWLFCRDERWRPVEPGTSPLAHGAPGRVGRLRAYGNAINAEAARVFIECVMETIP